MGTTRELHNKQITRAAAYAAQLKKEMEVEKLSQELMADFNNQPTKEDRFYRFDMYGNVHTVTV